MGSLQHQDAGSILGPPQWVRGAGGTGAVAQLAVAVQDPRTRYPYTVDGGKKKRKKNKKKKNIEH